MQLTAAAVTPPAEHAARRPAGAAGAAAADAGVRREFRISMLGCLVGIVVLVSMSGTSEFHAQIEAGKDEAKLYPVDEAIKNPSFLAFRDSLLRAVASQDREFLSDCTSFDILTGPTKEGLVKKLSIQWGPDSASLVKKAPWLADESLYTKGGKCHFLLFWFMRPPDWVGGPRESIWPILNDVLTMGGAFMDKDCTVFRAPYVWAGWPWNTDFFYAVTAESVPLFADSFTTDVPIDTLSYDLLLLGHNELIVGGPLSRFVNVRTAQGEVGAVETRYVRSPFGPKAEFRYIDGQWQMTRFSKGD
jgi:hypothetical protein